MGDWSLLTGAVPVTQNGQTFGLPTISLSDTQKQRHDQRSSLWLFGRSKESAKIFISSISTMEVRDGDCNHDSARSALFPGSLLLDDAASMEYEIPNIEFPKQELSQLLSGERR
jgi:hypothetical protein